MAEGIYAKLCISAGQYRFHIHPVCNLRFDYLNLRAKKIASSKYVFEEYKYRNLLYMPNVNWF